MLRPLKRNKWLCYLWPWKILLNVYDSLRKSLRISSDHFLPTLFLFYFAIFGGSQALGAHLR